MSPEPTCVLLTIESSPSETMDSMGGGSDNQPKRTQRSEVATLATGDLLIARKYGDMKRLHIDLTAIGNARNCIQKTI